MPTEGVERLRKKATEAVYRAAEQVALGRRSGTYQSGGCVVKQVVDHGKGSSFDTVSTTLERCQIRSHKNCTPKRITSSVPPKVLDQFYIIKACHDLTGRRLGSTPTDPHAEDDVLSLLEGKIEAAADCLRHYAVTGVEPPSRVPSPLSSLPPSSPPPSSPTMVASSDYNPFSSPVPVRRTVRMTTGGKALPRAPLFRSSRRITTAGRPSRPSPRRRGVASAALPSPPPSASSSRVTLEMDKGPKRKRAAEATKPNKKCKTDPVEIIDLTGEA
ncbi:hypothetical protein PQX77_013257 [Marasmius sp. AFHP31]|nr:hypothetical protein PQX77_013257 [Marasmius sp. AFHP31]